MQTGTEQAGTEPLVTLNEHPPAVANSSTGVEARMVTLCKRAYVRNNKRGGLKNLRCFPHCCLEGHNPLGFCGNHIYIVIKLPEAVPANEL